MPDSLKCWRPKVLQGFSLSIIGVQHQILWAVNTMQASTSSFPDRETVASRISSLGQDDQAWLKLLLENAQQDENLLEGLHLFLNQQSQSRFLNSLKLEKCGEWFGENASARLQIRLHEVSRTSQHPAFEAFRSGLTKSGGLEKAYPKSPL